jgi:phage/plasmid-like protein (TIGR03299 family)
LSAFNYVGAPVEGMSTAQATEEAKLNWTVSKRPIYVLSENDQDWHGTNKFFATTRDDNDHILGIVGPEYQVVQNEELMYLCERVQGSDVKIETAGFLNHGQRVWVQMRGNAFDVGPKGDVNIPMTLFTNGHDGQWPLSCLPTSVRVICQNTLNMALKNGRKSNMIISLKHTGNIQDRLEQMIMAIEQWKDRTTDFQTKAEALASVDVTTEFVQNFWTKVYTEMFGDIHDSPMNEQQNDDNKSAVSTMVKWSNTFDSEVKHSGANLWTAMNAVTYWLDHQQIYRGERKHENRFNDILFGNGAKEKVNVMNRALEFV